jgi:hypothetical protein
VNLRLVAYCWLLFISLLGTGLADDHFLDSRSGLDTLDGRTPNTARQSLKGLSLNSGDRLFLKRGSVWEATLVVRGQGIQIHTYGDGAAPMITGRFELLDWREESKDIWRVSVPVDHKKPLVKMFLASKALDDKLRKPTLEDLQEDGEWAWSQGQVWRKGDPAGLALSVNRLRLGMDLAGSSGVEVEGLVVERCRDGVLCGEDGLINELLVQNNSQNGVIVAGSRNRLVEVVSRNNGYVAYKGDRSGKKGQGFLVNGSDNSLDEITSIDNQEDGIQFGPEAGDGNQIINPTLRGNGENCVDVKAGDQMLIGGTLSSEAEDAVIVHKRPHVLVMKKVRVQTTGRGPALSVFGGARVEVTDCRLESEESSVIHIDRTAGDGCRIETNEIVGGGRKSGVQVHILGGKAHVLKDNEFHRSAGALTVKVEGSGEVGR